MPRLDPAAQRIVDLGQRLFGDNWQSKFGRMTGLSQTYVSMIAKGERPVTEAVHDAVTAGLKAESKRLRAQAPRAPWPSSTGPAACWDWLPQTSCCRCIPCSRRRR